MYVIHRTENNFSRERVETKSLRTQYQIISGAHFRKN